MFLFNPFFNNKCRLVQLLMRDKCRPMAQSHCLTDSDSSGFVLTQNTFEPSSSSSDKNASQAAQFILEIGDDFRPRRSCEQGNRHVAVEFNVLISRCIYLKNVVLIYFLLL